MKKATWRTYYNSRSIKLIFTIMDNEDLDINLKKIVDGVGDDVIEATDTQRTSESCVRFLKPYIKRRNRQ